MLFCYDDIEKYLQPYGSFSFDINDIPDDVREETIKTGEKYLNYDWGNLTASLYMEFAKNGNRTRYEDINFARRQALNCLVIAEYVEKEGRFLTDIINGIWIICEETTWTIPAHNGKGPLADYMKQNIDLFSAQTAAQLALCAHLLKDELDKESNQIVKRVEYEVGKRVIDPFIEGNYWWMNKRKSPINWTPWCTSTCMTACLILERDMDKRIKFIKKALEILTIYIEDYADDGGCDEGAGYWYMSPGCMLDCLELLSIATNGKMDIFHIPKIAAMGSYIYKMHIGGKYFVNFADCSAIADKGGARTYIFGKRVGDVKLQSFGGEDFKSSKEKLLPNSMNLLHKLMSLKYSNEIYSYNEKIEQSSDYYIESLQLYKATKNDLTIAVKGGHNDDNHNHNDVGSFIAYTQDTPLLIDLGVESYTKKTFSTERYTIWTMQSAYHNLPTINGYMQCEGQQYCATDVVRIDSGLSFDISKAYPKEALIKKWKRSVTLDDVGVVISEDFELESQTGDIKFSLMASKQPVFDGEKIIIEDFKIACDADLDVEIEKIDIPYDAKLTPVWGDCVYRIIYSIKQQVSEGNIKFIISKN